jgi:Flp pilus assembly protein TadD
MLVHLGRAHEAIPLLQQAVACDPQDARKHCLLSWAQLAAGDFAASETTACEAIAQNPHEEWAHRLLSLSLLKQDRPKDALAPALVSRQLLPRSPEPYANLVRIALAVRDTALAEQAATDLLAIAPEQTTSHALDGCVQLALGRNEVAVARYLEAIRLDPQNAVAHNDLGVALLRCGDRADALRSFQAAAELNPADLTSVTNIRHMARQDRFPLPRWARAHPFFYGPAFIVALVNRGPRRQHYDQLPDAARRHVLRWTFRDAVLVTLSMISGIASLAWLASLTGVDGISSIRDPALATALLCGFSLWPLLRRRWR